MVCSSQDGKGLYAALFNLSNKKRTVTLRTEEAGLPELTGKELWSGRKIKKARQLRAVLAPHDAGVWKVER